MRPSHLTIDNFASYVHEEVDFSDLSLVALVGANGSGKTSLLQAQAIALFGSAVGSLDGFVRQGAPGFRIDFTFALGDVTYTVTREHGKAQKASLLHDGKPVCDPKVRDVDAAIASLLGCDYAGFSLAHHLPQGALGAFVAMDPAARKDWLLANLPMRRWSALESAAKVALAESLAKVHDAEAVVRTLTEDVPDTDSLHAALITAAALVEQRAAGVRLTEAVVAKGAKAREERARVQAELTAAEKAHAGAQERFASAERSLTSRQAEADTLTIQRKRLEAEATGEAPDLKALESALDDARLSAQNFDAAFAEYQRWQADEKRLYETQRTLDIECGVAREHLAKFDAQAAPKCPVCGQAVKGAHFEASRNALKAAFDMAARKANDAADALEALGAPPQSPDASEVDAAHKAAQNASQRLTHARELAVKLDDHARLVKRIDEVAEDVARLEGALDVAEVAASDAHDALIYARNAFDGAPADESAEAAASLTAIRQALADAERQRTRIEADIARAESTRVKVEATEESLTAERNRADLLALLVKAYSKSGIPGRMLEGAVGAIEAYAGSFLDEFTDGLSLTISTQRENKGGGIRETLDLLVSDALGTRPIERFSGGEKTRIEFALAVGLSRFLSTMGAGNVESFVIDEVDALDQRGIDEFVACLHVLSRSVPWVCVVSHIDSIADSLPQRIVVRKGASGSRVEVSV